MDGVDLFYTGKGLLAGLGVLLLIVHMNSCWSCMADPAQRARYLCLLGFGVLLAGASAEQLRDQPGIELRNWGAMVMAAALVAVALYSMSRERRGRGTRRKR